MAQSFFAAKAGILSATITAAWLACAAPVAAQDTAEEDPIVARAGGADIRLSEVIETMAVMPPQLRQLPNEVLVPFVADQLAIVRVIAARARDEGLDEDEAVRRRIESAERAILRDAWLERTVEERMSDDAVQAAYDAFVADAGGETEIKARHILVETEQEALDVIAELDGGADFAELAREHSVGPSGENGGDLGWFRQGEMVAPFAEAAFALEPGTFSSEPVQTQFGWHVILAEDRRTAEPPPLDAVRDQLTVELREQLAQEILGELRQEEEIVIYGPDGQPIDPALLQFR